jgi:hypothetical protein
MSPAFAFSVDKPGAMLSARLGKRRQNLAGSKHFRYISFFATLRMSGANYQRSS